MIQNIRTLQGVEYAVHETTPYSEIVERGECFVVTTKYNTEIMIPYHAIMSYEYELGN